MRGSCACPCWGMSSGNASRGPSCIAGRAGQARGLRLAPRPPLVPHELCQPNRAMRSAFPRDPRRTGTRRCPYMELIQEDRHKALSLHGTYPARVGIPLQRPQQDRHKALSLQQCPIGEEGLSWRLEQDKHKAQYISNKRPSRFVILSETKDLARRTEILRFTQDDTPETASFDWQHVLFEMYCPLQVPWLRAGVPFGTPCSYAILLSC